MTRTKKLAKHLYIHIPFCNQICSYCDFVRFVSNKKTKSEYIKSLIKEIKKLPNNYFKTIYLGGGTPNSLQDKDLNSILLSLKSKLKKNAEFTIECNPELISASQVKIFYRNSINRISLGIQTTNDSLLKKINRQHDLKDCIKAIILLNKNKINNISVDFIYGFNELSDQDLLNAFEFIKNYQIKHASFYSLEIKDHALFKRENYQLDLLKIEKQLKMIENFFEENHWIRYEVSNWCSDLKYRSKHNLAYWLSDDWIGLGLGSYGFENMIYYSNNGSINKYKKDKKEYNLNEYYQHILIMGLRLVDGLNLNIKKYHNAYLMFKNKINHNLITIKNNFLKVKNINLLDNVLIDIV